MKFPALVLALFALTAAAPWPTFAAGAPATEAGDRGWVAAWATALQEIPQRADLPPLYRAPEVADRTVRQIVYPTLDGQVARLHLSNRYGRTPLAIGEVRIARASNPGEADAMAGTPVRFANRPSVTLPPGGEVDSDPVKIEIARGAPYAVSIYTPAPQTMAAWHRVASQVNRVSAPGNHAADESGAAYGTRFTQSVWLTSLAVQDTTHGAGGSGGGAVAAIGDSITDGMRSTPNRNQRWPDGLARRLAQAGGPPTAVLDLGISGNRLLSDSPCYGEALARRFGHDVLDKPGVTTAIVLIGINDINFAAMPAHAGLDCDVPHTAVNANDLIAGYRQVVAAAHQAGVRVLLATLTPASLPPPREATRLSVNQWIRSGGGADGTIDFDAALRDSAVPTRLQARYDSGDHIHPSDAGYAAMADAVPLDLLHSHRHP